MVRRPIIRGPKRRIRNDECRNGIGERGFERRNGFLEDVEDAREGVDVKKNGRTRNGMVSSIFWPDSAVPITVESGHGFLGKEGERFLIDWRSAKSAR